jgi:hypothetical protein
MGQSARRATGGAVGAKTCARGIIIDLSAMTMLRHDVKKQARKCFYHRGTREND